jgi:very-short-patch-repair endonuclease
MLAETMENAIIYGPDQPQIDFKRSPEDGMSFEVQNNHVMYFNDHPEKVTWFDLVVRAGRDALLDGEHELHPLTPVWRHTTNQVEPHDAPSTFEQFRWLVNHLLDMAGSEYERAFFQMFVNHSVYRATPLGTDREKSEDPPTPNMKSLWNETALIPQVWVNWIHYDSKSKERADRLKEEPFRVDFLLIDESIHKSPVIFEIDGMSHFGDWKTNQVGEKVFDPSLEEYTRHLRKDRWLRNHGWHVVRISNREVEKFEGRVDNTGFRDLLKGLVGGEEPVFRNSDF